MYKIKFLLFSMFSYVCLVIIYTNILFNWKDLEKNFSIYEKLIY